MAPRSIASLSLSFGLVSIPIKLYSATESSSAIRFKLMGAGGSRLRQQYVMDAPADEEEQVSEEAPEDLKALTKTQRAEARVVDFPLSTREQPVSTSVAAPPAPSPAVVERSEMVKGYEFEKGKFVLFTADELKALEEHSRQTIDIVAFVPEHAVDPIYYDKPYFLAPDKRGAKTYNLLLRAMQDTRRSALAKWAFRSKEYVVQIRPAEGGMVLQQLLYAEEVRSLEALNVERVDVGEAELELAKKLIAQISVDSYEPTEYIDEEKRRILAAVEAKIAGRQIVAPASAQTSPESNVVDLLAALRASLQQTAPATTPTQVARNKKQALVERKPAKRAPTRRAAPRALAKGRDNR